VSTRDCRSDNGPDAVVAAITAGACNLLSCVDQIRDGQREVVAVERWIALPTMDLTALAIASEVVRSLVVTGRQQLQQTPCVGSITAPVRLGNRSADRVGGSVKTQAHPVADFIYRRSAGGLDAAVCSDDCQRCESLPGVCGYSPVDG